LFGKLVCLFIATDALMLQHPNKGYLIKVCQCSKGIQAFCNQSRRNFRPTKCLKCSLAVRENKDPNLGARWGGWSAPRPGRFTPWKDPVPIV
jgi:hypothetical protein